MGKNVSKLYYPIKESILSILDLVDEFVVALGDSDEDDRTREEVLAIGSDKIKIIDTIWDIEKYPRGMENAHQTDIAKNACSGDWLFYLQADEVVHERYLPVIKARCEELLDDKEVEGLLFKYIHFWGDYAHYQNSHSWYPHEIRIVRNDPEIHSWESAQSFRRIPNFDGIHYRQQEGTYKLKVATVDAYIYHYGWVRPPQYMLSKRKSLQTIHRGKAAAEEAHKGQVEFDYGPMKLAAEFKGTHPKVMQRWIDKFDWADKLKWGGNTRLGREKVKHEKLKYRFITFLEQNFLGGRRIGGFKNYRIIRK